MNGAFGIEVPEDVESFVGVANALVDFRSRKLTIDLRECTRVWPSGVTLLCSLSKWTELSARRKPEIRSLKPQDPAVESYLQECGFYDFVGVANETVEAVHTTAYVVKIRREQHPSAIEQREAEVVSLLRRNARLTAEQIELFDAKVLTEVFNNVTEHGVALGDQGWWIMAQYHRTHRLISLCIADNGIGIRHTLLTGPQGHEIRERLGASASDDEYIRLALEESVSGAIDADLKTRRAILPDRYPRGSHRGNGLRRISDTCSKLGVPFSLVSQHGFVGVNADGAIHRRYASVGRIFAGTLYHFVLPA